MDSRKEDDGPAKPPLTLRKGAPSILYFVTNIPEGLAKDEKELKLELFSYFQTKKRVKGGDIVKVESQAMWPNSALLLFENAEEVSQLEQVPHHIKGQKVELYSLMTEHVTLELCGCLFFDGIMSSKEMAQVLENEELLLTKRNNKYVITGNWTSVQQFRDNFNQFMIEQLQKHPSEDFPALLNGSSGTNESTVEPEPQSQPESKPQPESKSQPESKPEPAEDASSDGSISAKQSSLNPDVLALMQKMGAYQHPALSYDFQTATINIDCEDPTTKEKVKEELFTAYRELMMGGKLKEHTFPIDDIQQASVIVDECSKTFNHTYFRYDSEKKEIKCLSTDARQMQNVRRRFTSIKNAQKVKSVYLDLPKMSRKVTIKLGDITEEEVDVIVNAANDRLMHGGGVAAAIDKASYGAVQRESSKIIEQTGTLSTGGAVVTTAGGKLKCNFVVHAVGPIAHEHKNQCGFLLHNACVNSMLLAQHNKAKSISFPPISSGIFGVSKELVANVMLSTLCSYTCSDPELLNDVRIVIIDDPTFDVFVKFFNKEKGNLELLQNTKPTRSTIYQHSMQVGNAPQLGSRKVLTNLVSIDLPKLGRRVTLKLGDIVQETVDVIVNSANFHLLHDGGVAAAINKASGGEVQRESTKIIHSVKLVPTGDAVATTAGGTLKCKFVIHAVGPTKLLHNDQCGSLLKKTCVSAMNIAHNFEAISIAFPPISSGIAGLSNELVANVMLSTLCSYQGNNPTLLRDVRIVIIDKPTFEVFLNVFQKEQQSLEQIHTNATTTNVIKPATFEYDSSGGNLFSSLPNSGVKMPGHAQPVLYSQAVTQQPLPTGEMKHVTSDNTELQSRDPSQPNSLNHSQPKTGQVIPETSGSTNFTSKSDAESSPFVSDLKDNPENAHGSIVTHVDSSGARNNSTDTDEKNTRNDDSITSGDNGDTKDDKHSEDVPIDKFKKAGNEENSEEATNSYVIIPSPNYDSSVDPASTRSNLKPTSGNASLQPALADPLSHTNEHEGISDERHGTSLGTSQNTAGSKPKQQHVSLTLHTKHLPSATSHSQTSLQKEKDSENKENKDKGEKNKKDDEKTEECPICYDNLKEKPVTAVTTCKHCKQLFCKDCLYEALKYKPYCPTCTVPLRKVTGNQPVGGTMTTRTHPKQKLPGYEQHGTIEIHYDIPNGIQGKEHPNPGQHFRGTSRTAYVPNSPEGKKVVRLLRRAFDARLIFTVGTSHTTGATNAVVWNDIHHKTSTSGGPTNYGYPDPTYLSRVLEELAAKGIRE